MGALKLFEVEISFKAVVLAESDVDACKVAQSELREITSTESPDVELGEEIRDLDDLPEGWSSDCLPYSRMPLTSDRTVEYWLDIENLLAPDSMQVVRDTKTIDMFAEGA